MRYLLSECPVEERYLLSECPVEERYLLSECPVEEGGHLTPGDDARVAHLVHRTD